MVDGVIGTSGDNAMHQNVLSWVSKLAHVSAVIQSQGGVEVHAWVA